MTLSNDSVTIFWWMNEDGTIEKDRDKIVDNVRKVVSQFKNSPSFIQSMDSAYDKMFNKT